MISGAERETRTTCPYCGVGCGVVVGTAGEGAAARIVGVRGDPQHPANFGRLCSKGSSLARTATPLRAQQARAAVPELRLHRGQPRVASDWDSALDHVAERFAATIAAHGPDSVAFYISGQLLTEDYYVFNKLAKGLIGTNNVDSNSRLCMSSAVAGYKQTLGADAPPACYDDIDAADCLFITGSNTAWAHPIVFRRIEAARARRPDMKIVVVDPRRTETAAFADLHLPILPGTDIALYNAMLHLMLWEDWIDRSWIASHTEGFDALREAVRECTPAWAAQVCGIDAAQIAQATRWFACSPATLSMWCQGLNQSSHGTASNAALIDLHLATGQIGRAGAGPLSLTGQPNAMGGRETGGMANLASGHRDLANAEHRAEIARLWGVDDVPARPGRTAVELFDAVRRGEVRMLWIACTNPAQSLPDAAAVHEALGRAELVVVQEAFRDTATAAYADVLLPATSWGEKDGTVTNSERRISRVRAALPPYAQSRHDWMIAADFGRRLEARLRPGRPTLFPWNDAEWVWNEHRETTRGRDLDIGGLDWARLEADGPQQWPFPEGASRGRARLYEDGVFPTASGRARFVVTRYALPAERVDARHPIALITGRLRDQWHGMSRTGVDPLAFGHAPEPVLEMNVDDMARRGLGDGALVRVGSRRAAVMLPVRGADGLRPGTAFAAMHWGPEFLGGHGADPDAPAPGINGLTCPATDPVSHQPELKHAAVRIERWIPAGRLVAFGWLPAADAHLRRVAMRTAMARFEHASCVPFGDPAAPASDAREGLLFRAAGSRPIGADDVRWLVDAFGLAGEPMLAYDDPRRAASRRVLLRDGALGFVLLAGELDSEPWLREMLMTGAAATGLGARLLSGTRSAPAGLAPRGEIVCNCFGVGTQAIDRLVGRCDPDLDEKGRLDLVQKQLRCGTNCGSCLPELRARVAVRAPVGSRAV